MSAFQHHLSRRQAILGMAAPVALAAGLVPPRALAQAAFPIKPVRVVVPFAAGGGTDGLARALGDRLSRELGQPFLIDSKPGAGTVIGNDIVAKSPADGYTLLLTTTAFTIVPSISAKLPYGGSAAFAPVTLVGRSPNVIVVRADSPLKSLGDLLAQARKNPGKLNYGSSGAGSTVHLAAELLNNLGGISTTHVPYRGGSQQITALLGGEIDMAYSTMPSVAAFVSRGQLRALAVTSARRSPVWPDVPAVAEAVPGYEADVWFGVLAPAGTPADAVKRLHEAFQRAAQVDTVRERAKAEGLALTLDGPEEFARVLRVDEARWRKVVQDQKITVD